MIPSGSPTDSKDLFAEFKIKYRRSDTMCDIVITTSRDLCNYGSA